MLCYSPLANGDGVLVILIEVIVLMRLHPSQAVRAGPMESIAWWKDVRQYGLKTPSWLHHHTRRQFIKRGVWRAIQIIRSVTVLMGEVWILDDLLLAALHYCLRY